MVHNFSAGPSILPQEAVDNAANALKNFAGTELPVVSVSHRSKEVVAMMQEGVDLVKELLNVPAGYQVLFLQGGASLQFSMVPFNFLPADGKAAYVNTGSWTTKAIKEAKLFGTVEVLASSEDSNFNYIPKGYEIPSDAAYLHLCSNNTIFGTTLYDFPKTDVPVVCDMSSEIFSRPIDVSKFDLIYAGAQKNMGPAGVTLVIVKDELAANAVKDRHIPTMLKYDTHIKKESAFNTPPVFAIYLSVETLKWVKANGGVEAMETRAKDRAELLYNEIERNPLFRGTAAAEDRSRMNATFVFEDAHEGLTEDFLAAAKAANISGIKGHRSVGGFRASMYNAMEMESVQALVNLMTQFAEQKA